MLKAAVVSDNVFVLRELLLLGCNINVLDKESMSLLHWAYQSGSLQTATVLVEQNASVDMCSKDGSTPAHKAAESGSVGILKLLFYGGADMDARNNDEETPLHLACK